MKDSFYMQEELERINKKIIDLYNDGLTGTGGVIAPEEAMQMLSILKDVMGDYLFITNLDITSENEPASV